MLPSTKILKRKGGYTAQIKHQGGDVVVTHTRPSTWATREQAEADAKQYVEFLTA